jgi:hypothetical protein
MCASRAPRCVASPVALALLLLLGACAHRPSSRSELECMARVMYFESIRSSDEGMLAVGTVVMNRVKSDKYPDSVCAVVGQKNQFAPGVLSKPMPAGKSRDRALKVAKAVLGGKRHRGVGNAMFFHTAGRTYSYSNMHYVLVAGGNAFYERSPTRRTYIPRTVIAQAGPTDSITPTSRFARRNVAAPGHLLAHAAPPVREPPRAPVRAPRPAPVLAAAAPPAPAPAGLSIEALILADAGF